jgi:dolichol-phosphate mannosyltransferase
MNIVIILPTYNERENIASVIHSLQSEFPAIPHRMNILVVDDSSPDGTADVVKDESRRYPNVFLLSGQKQGLGAAYIRGMKYAMDELRAEAVMEMDADFSHKPEDVPRLIARLDAGADFVIGSRYVVGGKIPKGWGVKRRMISKWGNLFARYVAGLYGVRDCTAGFRAIRTTLLRKINLDALGVRGYAFQLALLHQAVLNGAQVREVPVEFVDRVKGVTKLRMSDIIEFMLNSWRIRFESSRTFFKFAAVGVSGLFVNLASFTLFLGAGLNKFLASPLAIEISIITNFLLNNAWTFASRETRASFPRKLVKFNIVSLVALAASYSTFLLLSVLFPQGTPQVHQAIGVIPGTVVNYVFNSLWTFRSKPRDYPDDRVAGIRS